MLLDWQLKIRGFFLRIETPPYSLFHCPDIFMIIPNDGSLTVRMSPGCEQTPAFNSPEVVQGADAGTRQTLKRFNGLRLETGRGDTSRGRRRHVTEVSFKKHPRCLNI